MEHLDVLKQFGVTSLEDARELAELTDRIVADLKTINENDCDLEELERQTSNIVANLKAIEEGLIERGDLDGLAEQTSAIVANLKVIEEQA
jgi:pyruvate-formate lyase-activating enzyme